MVMYTTRMSTMEKTTGQRIREVRKERGLYQHELAAKAKLSTQSIRNIEAGRHEPRLPALRRIAGALGVPVSELLD